MSDEQRQQEHIYRYAKTTPGTFFLRFRIMRMLVAVPGEVDREVVVRATRGDAHACREIVLRYEVRVFALLSRMLPRPMVEDVAQETFLRAFRSLASYRLDGNARLSTWLLSIATHLAIDELRRKKKLVALEAAASVASPELPVDVAADRKTIGRAIEAALLRLDPEFRAAFVLSAYHELSHEEIAGVLGVEIGTVKSRLSRARAVLRDAVELQNAR